MEALAKLGSSAEGSRLRAELHSLSLLSDMQVNYIMKVNNIPDAWCYIFYLHCPLFDLVNGLKYIFTSLRTYWAYDVMTTYR